MPSPRLHRFLPTLSLAGVVACSGSSAAQSGSAPAPQEVRVAAPGSLNRFAAERVMVIPAQGVAAVDPLGWRARAGVDRALLMRVDSAFEARLAERGLASWVFVGALVRSAKRNPTYITDPYQIRATGAVRVALRAKEQMIIEPLASQLRGLAGVSDARWALVPLEVTFLPDAGGGGRVRLALAMIDVRGAQVRWVGDVLGDAHTDYSFAAIDSAILRAADLVVPQ